MPVNSYSGSSTDSVRLFIPSPRLIYGSYIKLTDKQKLLLLIFGTGPPISRKFKVDNTDSRTQLEIILSPSTGR